MNEESVPFKIYTVPRNDKIKGYWITWRGCKVHFSITIMQRGAMQTALEEACSMIDAHLDSEGLAQIHPDCFWRDEADQRPTDEQNRNTSDFAQPSNYPDNWLRIRKVSRGTTKSGSPQVYLFADPNSSKPDLQFPPKFAKSVNAKTGIDWAADVNAGKMVTCDFTVEWKWSDDGKYKNFVRIVEPAQAMQGSSQQRSSDIPV